MNANLPSVIGDPAAEVAALVVRYRRANGPVMTLMNRFGGQVERQLALLPQGLRGQIEGLVIRALRQGHDMAGAGARFAPDMGSRVPLAAVALTGAAGGLGGLPTALAEVPLTVTLILHQIRRAAEAEGFDPDDDRIRAECLAVFSAGGPLAQDDGVNTAFLGARMALNGAAVNAMVARIAPKFAAAISQKLAAQAVPVIGAVSGAALNMAFMNYYRELAQIRFRLLRLATVHGAEPVLSVFARAVQPVPVTKA